MVLVMAMLLAGVSSADAQDRTFGLGIGISPAIFSEHGISSGVTTTVTSFYMPITVSPVLRIEPEFGISRFWGSSGTFSASESRWTFGIGVLGRKQRGDVIMYYGSRPGVFVTRYGGSLDGSLTAWRLSAVFGGEYFFTRHLGIGGEAQGNYFLIGDLGDNEDWPDTGLMTNVVLFVRWYP